ncbi:MAG: GNAT family N-acetyltransferase [Lachnospiraceae bacterium]|nr:GNAT family N-acetyltransferase [Lachnospiraceae bacterium]
MKIRRLEQQEHEWTRELYEQVFSEDSREFVDYYYAWKTKDNIIYAAEDEEGIHAMVHLNPFLVSVEGKLQKLHYIVAVATQEEYRHQGWMRRLLELAEQEMKQRGEKFTFLMPASEKIYQPFGYRFFAWQRRGILRVETAKDTALKAQNSFTAVCRPARPQEYGALALFANGILEKRYEVFVYRDADYYERLCAEQRCQGGEVMVIVQPKGGGQAAEKADATEETEETELGMPKGMVQTGTQENGNDRIIGTFCTAREEPSSEFAMEIREVIFAEDRQKEAMEALREYVNGCGDCRVAGCHASVSLEQEASVPLLMGKAPGAGEFSSPWEAERIFINEVV